MQPEEIKRLAISVIEKESASVAHLVDQIDDSLPAVVQMLLNCTGHVLVTGAGTSHAVGLRLAHLLSCSGTPSLFIHPGDSLHGLGGAVTENDVLIALSKGGETAEINYLAELAKNRRAKVIGFTEKPDSTLGGLSDQILCVRADPDVDPYGMIATGSSLTNSAMGDVLCIVLLKMRGYSQEQFGETHPGGAVGKKLKSIKEQENRN